jgi:hypothetical protein
VMNRARGFVSKSSSIHSWKGSGNPFMAFSPSGKCRWPEKSVHIRVWRIDSELPAVVPR